MHTHIYMMHSLSVEFYTNECINSDMQTEHERAHEFLFRIFQYFYKIFHRIFNFLQDFGSNEEEIISVIVKHWIS